jgi:ParB/RepB/Spo0J family partition protein
VAHRQKEDDLQPKNNAPRSQTVALTAVKVGDRRREDFGDLDSLAKSIRQHGLLHPIVVTENLELMAGERRLRACMRLGWSEIDVRMLDDLTDTERRAIELEENIRRKDLTEYERSKALVSLADTAAEVDKEEADLAADFAAKSRGRPTVPGSDARIADRIGVPVRTLQDTRQHVAAVETFRDSVPAIVDAPKSVAVDFARTVEEFPELSPDQSPGLPPDVVVDLGRTLRRIPEGPDRDEAIEGAANYHKFYGQPTPAEVTNQKPAIRAMAVMRLVSGVNIALGKVERTSEKIGGWDLISDNLAELEGGEALRRDWLGIIEDALTSIAVLQAARAALAPAARLRSVQ